MTESKPSDGQELAIDELESQLTPEQRKAYEAGVRMATEKHVKASLDVRQRAIDVSVECVTDVAAAPRFTQRHNERIITGRLADLLYRYLISKDQNEKSALYTAIEQERSDQRDFGFFLLQYEEELLRRRLELDPFSYDGGYAMIEVSARHPSPNHKLHTNTQPVSDAQFHIPGQGPQTQHVVALPPEQEHEHPWLSNMRLRPQCVTLLEDIVCIQQMSHTSVASHALKEGLRMIRSDINPRREACEKIEYVVAELASIRGFKLKDGTEVSLSHDLNVAPLFNYACELMLRHFNHRDVSTSFEKVYDRPDEIPVIGHPYVSHLHVTWCGLAANLLPQ